MDDTPREERATVEHRRSVRVLTALGAPLALIALVWALGTAPPVHAQEDTPDEEIDRRWDSAWCIGCHDGSTLTATFPSGEELALDVDGDAFSASTHAETGVECVHCHRTIARFPHLESTIPDARTFTTELAKSCGLCHWPEHRTRLDGAHALLTSESEGDLPLCTDCHDPHAVQGLAVDHPAMQARCAACHTDEVSGASEAIHTLDPTLVEEASAPPLILFYILILVAVLGLVVVAWGLVTLVQWARRRGRSAAPSAGLGQ